ncbi:uncharacterized protein V6R79_017756 [Siganus canaliculatus]
MMFPYIPHLILTGLMGIHCKITTVSKVSVKAGDSISIPCLYNSKYRDNVKYLCQGYSWSACSDVAKTNQINDSGKFSISDDPDQTIVKVAIHNLTVTDSNYYYWCAVDRSPWDEKQYFLLAVTSGKQGLSVDEQLLTAFRSDNITINCKHDVSGIFKWCKIGTSCVTGSGSIAGTRVTITTGKTGSTVHMSGLRIESSGWYWCDKGDLQMPVHLTVTERPTTRIHGITTVRKVSVRLGGSINIPCLYDKQYRGHVKYLCEGYSWKSCFYAVKTNQQNSPKYSISDNKDQRIFSVTIRSLTTNNKYYWCAVEVNRNEDVRQFFELSVTSGKQGLSVDEQLITAFRSDNITINCKHDVSGIFKWCKIGNPCVIGSGSIAGTRVTITTEKTVSTVHMSGLRIESSGWYWCDTGDLQMPVHLTVTERPTTSQTTTTVVGEQDMSEVRKPDYLISLIIRLVVLVFIVLGTLFIWFMLKRHKQMRGQSSPTAEEDVTYSADKTKRKTTNQNSITEDKE